MKSQFIKGFNERYNHKMKINPKSVESTKEEKLMYLDILLDKDKITLDTYVEWFEQVEQDKL